MQQLTLFEDLPKLQRRTSISVNKLFIEDVGLDILSKEKILAKKTRYALLCPFHREKTPSFYLIPSWNKFRCFGCNSEGGPLQLISELHNSPVDYLKQKVHYDPNRDAVLLRQALENEQNRIYFSFLDQALQDYLLI